MPKMHYLSVKNIDTHFPRGPKCMHHQGKLSISISNKIMVIIRQRRSPRVYQHLAANTFIYINGTKQHAYYKQ